MAPRWSSLLKSNETDFKVAHMRQSREREKRARHAVPLHHPFFNSSALMGSRRMRLPVTENTAFPTAGAIGGTPGSPTPVGGSWLGTI